MRSNELKHHIKRMYRSIIYTKHRECVMSKSMFENIPNNKNVSIQMIHNVFISDNIPCGLNVSYEIILTYAKNEKYSQGFLPGSYSFSFCYITRVVLGSCRRTERS